MKNKFKIFSFIFIIFYSTNLYSIDSNNIIINGNSNIDKDLILSIINSDESNLSNLTELINKIYNTGFFKDVKINKLGEKIIIDLITQPSINKIIFDGNKRFKDEELFELINLNKNLNNYNVNKIDNFIISLKELYYSFGYNLVEISHSVDNLNDNSLDLKFNINEGKISKINSVEFIGNFAFDDRLLLDQIKSKPRNSILFFTKRNFKLYQSQNDTNEIINFYKKNGFKNASVNTEYEFISSKNSFNILFKINEGQKYIFNEITLNIDDIELDSNKIENINNIFYSHVSKIIDDNTSYNSDYFADIRKLISDFLFDNGLMFFKITLNEKENDLLVDVLFNIENSSALFVNQIKINGNTRTLDKVIRRELTIAEGDAINDFNIQNSIRNLRRLNIFKKVEINQNKISSNKVDLDVLISEKSTGDFQVGLSIGSLDGYTFITGLNEKNIGGTGRNLNATINTSKNNTKYSLNVIEPRILNKKLDLIYGFNYSELDKTDSSSYKLDTFNTNLGVQYNLTDDLFHKIILKYDLKKYDVKNINLVASSIANAQGSNAEIVLSNILSFNDLNSFMRPSSGSFYRLSNQYSPVTNSDNGYVKNIFLFKKYAKFNKNIFSFQSNIGNIFSLQNKQIDNDNKFSLGGRWLRGFDSYGVGPRNSSATYIGGNNLAVAKFDLSRPLLSLKSDNPIDLNIFTDIGKVFGNKITPTSSKESIRSSYGFGVKFYSVIGPIGFSWAFPIEDESFDIKRQFLFTIGDIN